MTNYKTIPTWNEGVWEETEFQTIDDFRVFIDEIFIEPGKYEFDETQEKPYIQDVDGNVITINFNTDTEGNA